MSEKVKTKDLSPLDYLRQLQLEYICAELRKRIYPQVRNKDFYKNLMEKKAAKIEDISKRNGGIDTIFNNEALKIELYAEIYVKDGLPKFLYNEFTLKENFEKKDIRYYYSKGSDVQVKNGNQVFLGTILNINIKAGIVEVEGKNNDNFGIFPMNCVKRIL